METSRLADKLNEYDVPRYLKRLRGGRKPLSLLKSEVVFAQGDPARRVFYLLSGQIKLVVLSKQKKEAVVGLLGPGSLFGEWCVSGHVRQLASAQAVTDCSVLKLDRKQILAAIHKDSASADFMISYLLRNNRAIQENVVDLMFNSTEKRLARALLLMARFGGKEKPLVTVPRISQDTLAALIGSTRTQVNFLMNKFKQMGFVRYDGGMEIQNSLLNVLLQDD
jgi:CRP-like cAMP-binding protein